MLTLAQQDPSNRRLIISAWNPCNLKKMTLPPCHYMYQINIKGDYIDVLFKIRSVDIFLGLPFHVASYAALTHILARILGFKSPTGISNLYVNVMFNYNNYKDYRTDINYLYTEIINRLKIKGLIN